MTKKKKSRAKTGKLSARQLRAELKRFFQRNPKKQFNPKQILRKIKLKNSRDAVQDALEQLAQDGHIIALGDYKYKAGFKVSSKGKSIDKVYEGRVDLTRSGAAYILVDGKEDDIYVSEKRVNTAMHGDRVKVKVWQQRGRRRPEGEVVEVVKRAATHFVGAVHKFEDHAIITTDGKRPMDITVPADQLQDAKADEKVVVEITDWSGGRFKNPLGRVTAVLGKAGSSDIEMQAILINNGFQISFPDEVMQEAGALETQITDAEIEKRRDLRDVITFTIDPHDAKDFDDAISLRYLDNGRTEVGVHIADVTHYVQPNTALDKEAFDRSTSVYLVDRVCPMLPEQISNVLCSLRPKEDKLSFSAIFELDDQYQVQKRWFGKTVIHSDRRFTYDEAQEILEGKAGDFQEELLKLNDIAEGLRKRRFKNGSIEFDSEEVRFRLDEDGTPLGVYLKERKAAHMLVEDFMLLANREVATYMVRKEARQKENIPFVFRVHDEPDPDRVAELSLFAKAMGLELDVSNPRAIARSYNRIVKAAETEPGLKMLGPIAIRTMAKAIYTTENIGHYGLGFENYTHFTSPIRRYADVLVHRILEKNLGGTHKVNGAQLEEQCGHISRQERKAADAERESIKYKQVEYMEKHVGEEFPGRVTGIADFGVFVALIENQCEGMISYDHMDESYEVGSAKLSIEGRRTGKVIRMGDALQVKILDTDLKARQISMGFVKVLEGSEPTEEQKSQPKKTRNKQQQNAAKSDKQDTSQSRPGKSDNRSRRRKGRRK